MIKQQNSCEKTLIHFLPHTNPTIRQRFLQFLNRSVADIRVFVGKLKASKLGGIFQQQKTLVRNRRRSALRYADRQGLQTGHLGDQRQSLIGQRRISQTKAAQMQFR